MVLAALALAHPAPGTAQGTAAARTVTVRSGDTLEGISQRTGVSVTELKRLNGLKDADLLQVGQTLRLPTPPRKGVVVVKSGDTLDSIAKANNTTVTALQKSNPGTQPTNLKVGSTLRLPASGGQSAPAKGDAAAPAGKAAPAPIKAAASPSAPPAKPAPPAEVIQPPASPLTPPTLQPPSPSERGDSTSRGRWRYFGDTVVDWGAWKRLPDGVRFTLVQAAARDVGEARAQATAIAVDCATLRHTWRVKEAWEAWSIPAPRSVGQLIVLDLCGNAAGDDRRPVPPPPSPSP
jgi:LysM repeat protein